MEESRTSSDLSLADFNDLNDLNDHRGQPHSMPRASFSAPAPDQRRFSVESRAVSARSVMSQNQESTGILLNANSESNNPSSNMADDLDLLRRSSRRARRLTRGSVISAAGRDDENTPANEEARIQFDGNSDDDVCFPMSVPDKMASDEDAAAIDFDELDGYAKHNWEGNHQYRSVTSDEVYQPEMPGHRPLVPPNFGARPVHRGQRDQVREVNQENQVDAEVDAEVETNLETNLENLEAKVNSTAHATSLDLLSDISLGNLPAQSQVSPASSDTADTTLQAEEARTHEKSRRHTESSLDLDDPTHNLKADGSTPFAMDRFSFFGTESEETVHAPDLASLMPTNGSFRDLFNSSSHGTWWLDCLDVSEFEMRALSLAFGIHPLTAEDIRTEESREKVELFRGYYFVCFHTFDSDPESETFLDPVNMYFVVFKQGILSFHFSPVQHCANVRRRIRQLHDYVSVSSDWICYALIDDITDSFAPIIREIEVETDVIEDSVFVARENDFGHMLYRIGEARRKVMTLLRLLFGKADVIKMFAKRCSERFDNAPRGEIGLYLGDIQDHIITMYQNLSVYEKIFSRSHANYLAQLQVESVHSNNQVTKVLGVVTVIGTIIVPLNIITGLFGMNVKVPGGGQSNYGWFIGIVCFMVLFVVTMSFVARYWLLNEDQGLERASSGSSIRSSAASILSRRFGRVSGH